MIVAHDLRRYPRVRPPKEVVVAWQSGVRRGVSYVDNLGVGGMFVRTRDSVPVRGMVQILLDMPVGQVRCKAVVRRVRENHGMAVQIVDMDPSDRARLSQQMKTLLPT